MRRAGPGAGLVVGRFEGDDYALGLAFGRLTGARIVEQEAQLENLFRALVPNTVKRFGLRQLFSFRLRALSREVPPDLLLAIAGVSDGYEPQPPPSGWPAFRRLIDLHALHEVSQRFVDAPSLQTFCTGFLASGKATRTGDTLLARNFDFEGGSVFDREKVVSVMVPEGKIPYLAVGFPGMVGVVSGFNREGIGVAVQSIAGGETGTAGEPVTLLVADVLRNERTLEGAIERIRRARVFVSDLILLGDGRTGKIAVVEKTPSAFAVRDGGSGTFLGATNEPATEAVRRLGLPLPPGSTSRRREQRLLTLLRELTARGSLDVPAAVGVLRDRRSASGADLGVGNRGAIDGLIASHSVVMDLSARRAWVATAPHTLGAYVPIDLETVLAGSGETLSSAKSIAPDPLLTSGAFDRYRLARRALARVRRLEREKPDGWEKAVLSELRSAHSLSPDFVDATARLGEALARGGEKEKGLALLDEALRREPAPALFAKGVESLRDALAGGRPLPPRGILAWFPEPDELIEESGARDVP
ncbi:MAG TPA: C45 family peptidase [Thermoanaerobaculia bacterium]|nr:C45 family peptidase [Thermoanaerobaculia bacterium]